MKYAILASLALAFVVGCENSTTTPSVDAPKQPISPRKHPKLSIALLGDHIRLIVAEQFTEDDYLEVIVPSKDANAAAIAGAAFQADFIFLVTDATQGPMPIHREHSMILRQLGITSIGLLFANTKPLAGMSDATELLELEELEIREILNAYDLPGDDVTCFHDTKLSAFDDAQQLVLGIPAIRAWLKRKTPKSRPAPSSSTSDKLNANIYLMTKQESEHSKSLANDDSVEVFINGNLRAATVGATSQLALGSSSLTDLLFDDPVAFEIGDRFLVIVDGHAIGAGVVTKVGR